MRAMLRVLVVTLGTSGLASVAGAAAPDAVERFVVLRNGVQIESLAQGHGPVIVVLPSLGRSGEDYDQVAAKLAADASGFCDPSRAALGRATGPWRG